MRQLYLVYQEHAGRWDWSKGLREQARFEEHARFMDDLVAKDVVLLGGPLDEKDVLLVVDATSIDEVRTHFADDPWIENGLLTIKEIRPWSIALDSTMKAASQSDLNVGGHSGTLAQASALRQTSRLPTEPVRDAPCGSL